MATPRILNEIQDILEKGIKKYDVPGATLAVLYKDTVYTAAAGVLNVETAVKTTNDSIFQIGSITKVFTGTLIMQLVDEGRIDLDEPVKTYLPTFQVKDPNATHKITLRHLLTHTGGIEGDFFEEADYGRDKLARYLDKCTLLPQLHPVGEYTSYSNSGLNIAGRIVEAITGKTWEEAMCERIFEPLGMDHSVVRAEQTLRFRTAIGHLPIPEKDQVNGKTQMLTTTPYLNSTGSPSGATTTMSASDLIKFVRLHLNDNTIAKGRQVLSGKSIKDMQTPQWTMPKYSPEGMVHWGLTWTLLDWEGTRLINHNGGTVGQNSFLHIFPDQKAAIVLLTNGMNARPLKMDIYSKIVSELAGVNPPELPETCDTKFDLVPYAGRYESIASWMEIFEQDGKLKAKNGSKVFSETEIPVAQFGLSPIEKDHFLVTGQGDKPFTTLNFMEETGTGQSQYLFFASQLMKRT